MRDVAARIDRQGRRVVILAIVLPLLHGLILFAAAGRLAWPRGWIYLGLMAACLAGEMLFVCRRNPAVINARGRSHGDSERWDLVVLRIHVLLMLSTLALSGLDAGRWRLSEVPLALSIAAGVVLALAFAIGAAALAHNPFFEPTVRIQRERGHRVIDGGPYRFVRHPGYLSAILTFVSVPLFLGSWLGLVSAGLDVVLFVVRAHLEDRTLRARLPGYDAYARRVPALLVPGRAALDALVGAARRRRAGG